MYGETKDDVAGYLYDNGSTNKTKLNGKVIEGEEVLPIERVGLRAVWFVDERIRGDG